MEHDESAECFDTITCQSGQFGFFQKRLFLINTLIQSACISVLLYACACMPEVDETDDNECGDSSGSNFVIAVNGYHYHNMDSNYSDSTTTGTGSLTTALHNHNAFLNVTLQAILNQNLSTVASATTLRTFFESNTPGISGTSEYIREALTGTSSPATTAVLEYILGDVNTASSQGTASLNEDPVFSNTRETESDIINVVNLFRENFTQLTVDIEEVTSEYYKQNSHASIQNQLDLNLSITSPRHDSLANATLKYDTSRNIVNSSTIGSEFVTMSTSMTSYGNSTMTCSRAFILFRTDLKKTQILESLSLPELVQLTSYSQGFGMILGALLGSMMADIYGRRSLLYISLAGMLILHCLMALSISWIMFIFLRTVALGCAGATLVISFVTVIEFVGPDWRDACTCSCFWTFGTILLSLETLVTLNWRCLALLSGGICLPLIATYFSSTESLRWLQCQHRFTEAEWGFREVVSVNSNAVPDLTTLLDQSRGCIVNNMHSKKFTYLDLFHSLDSAKWTVALVYACTVSSTVYFSLYWRVKEMTSLIYFDGFLPFVIDLPLTWSVVVMNRCLGRRWCLFLYAVASGFALLSVMVLHITGNLDFLPSLVTGLAFFGKIGVTASLSLILLITIEMYPTVTRCMGVAVAVASATGGSMLFNAFVFLERYHYTVPFVVYGLMMSSVGVLGLVFPETLRKPLKNVQQCRHRKIPLMEGSRLVGRPPSLWDAV